MAHLHKIYYSTHDLATLPFSSNYRTVHTKTTASQKKKQHGTTFFPSQKQPRPSEIHDRGMSKLARVGSFARARARGRVERISGSSASVSNAPVSCLTCTGLGPLPRAGRPRQRGIQLALNCCINDRPLVPAIYA